MMMRSVRGLRRSDADALIFRTTSRQLQEWCEMPFSSIFQSHQDRSANNSSAARSFCSSRSLNESDVRISAASSSGLSGSNSRTPPSSAVQGDVQWVFLGAPGVGKGTYAGRLGQLLGVPHISTGDLVREEMKKKDRTSTLTEQVHHLVSRGQLLPDELVLELLHRRLQRGRGEGETGFILDGFPRTTSQAEALQSVADISLAMNLSLREEVLVTKMLGRRECRECGRGFNLADIHLPASPCGGRPAIDMPALLPPAQCMGMMSSREDDTEDVVQARLAAYKDQSAPVESFYRRRGLLLDFEITGGIPETWPRLLHALGIRNSDGATLRPVPQPHTVALSQASSSHTSSSAHQLHSGNGSDSDMEAEGGRQRRQAVASL